MVDLQNAMARQNDVASFREGRRQRFNTPVPKGIIFTVTCNYNNTDISLVQSHEIKPLPSQR